jgi:hypothetical protein
VSRRDSRWSISCSPSHAEATTTQGRVAGSTTTERNARGPTRRRKCQLPRSRAQPLSRQRCPWGRVCGQSSATACRKIARSVRCETERLYGSVGRILAPRAIDDYVTGQRRDGCSAKKREQGTLLRRAVGIGPCADTASTDSSSRISVAPSRPCGWRPLRTRSRARSPSAHATRVRALTSESQTQHRKTPEKEDEMAESVGGMRRLWGLIREGDRCHNNRHRHRCIGCRAGGRRRTGRARMRRRGGLV